MSDTKSYMRKYVQDGLEKLAFDKDEAAALAEYFYQTFDDVEFEKQAGMFSAAPELFVKGLSEGGGKVGAALAAGVGILGAQRIYKGLVENPILNAKFDRALDQAISRNQVLQHADKSRVQAMAASIFRYAPNAAADPNLLSSILSNAVMMDGIDPQVIQTLLNLEKGYKEANKSTFADIMAKG